MNTVAVKGTVLRWAIERSRLTPQDLDKRFPKWQEWVDEVSQPTLKQLESFAKATYTAIGFLFLEEPPAERLPIPDFRTIGATPFRPSADLLETVYLCQQRQEWYREYARTVGMTPRPFVHSARLNEEVVPVAARIRDILGFSIQERQRMSNWTEALRSFYGLAEEAGILVMVSGVVGSNNKRKLDPQEFRGFALVDDVVPLIFVNGADTKSAQMFTLAHEIAHIWLGQSGVSEAQIAVAPEQQIERWCNSVAAEVLMPIHSLEQEYNDSNDAVFEMDRLARLYKVSTLVSLRRIHDIGKISTSCFWDLYKQELEKLRRIDARSTGGGDFYKTLGVRVSKSFARALMGSVFEGKTLFREAHHLLGVSKTATFKRMAHELGVLG